MERIETESNLRNKFVRMDGIIVARRSGKYSKLFRSQRKRKLWIAMITHVQLRRYIAIMIVIFNILADHNGDTPIVAWATFSKHRVYSKRSKIFAYLKLQLLGFHLRIKLIPLAKIVFVNILLPIPLHRPPLYTR